ncbi:hypothetical protein [Thalassotalea marina]|uniref:Uncharacterized protein n=1 Tax=Thalassotalea marina TaxID=1673741 RepID=A0A919BQS4_9GAMM|nr:hypothetical protein [Thalassotalea marina]GHG06357.1 hypothetical protein GCM10017161_39970 [Thalassotalea marina]
MLNKFTISEKSIFLLWLLSICSYLLFVFITDSKLEMVWLLAISNIAIFPSLFKRSKLPENRVVEPKNHVRFIKGDMYIGDAKVRVSEVRKVALETVEQDAYFSLPYNHVKLGEIPNMVFSADKAQEFKAYLKTHLSNDVVFIK